MLNLSNICYNINNSEAQFEPFFEQTYCIKLHRVYIIYSFSYKIHIKTR